MSITALQEYTRFSRYAIYRPELHRRETWQEQVDRVFDMHEKFLGPDIMLRIKDDFSFAKKMVLQKRILGSQRALQFGGSPILKKNARMYNCTVSYCDRPRFFQEAMWLLLCGCGVGFSVQFCHVNKLPEIRPVNNDDSLTYVIPDTIEGWADAIGVLVSSYFVDKTPFPQYFGKRVLFDYSLIRPNGAPLSFGAKAPGPDKLKESLDNISHLLDTCAKHQISLKPINAYDIVMYSSEAVLSGGIRRSATICLFSPEDNEMADSKIGAWRKEFKHRARSNNSAILIRDTTTKETFSNLMKRVKEFGEPGFIWSDHKDALYNPCGEIGMRAKLDLDDNLREKFSDEVFIQNNDQELSGWQFCNLCEINSKKANTEEKFLEACKAAAILGTIQAKYTDFGYLGEVSKMIAEKEALLGVSMTGMVDCPEVSFNPEIQRKGAELILSENERMSSLIGINLCARATCVKPAGTTSCILGTASGIHPHHAKRYFRRVQSNKNETPLQYFKKFNPAAVEQSVWASTDEIITFLCEVPDGVKTKNTVCAIDLLDNVKLTQQNWVESGTRYSHLARPWLKHNVSNTIHVQPNEWIDVENYIYDNRMWFAGISLLPVSGDKDYPQSPFTAVFTPYELVRMYGDASVFASGLIVDGLRAFNNDLWAACDCVLGIGEILNANELKEKIILDCQTNGTNWRNLGLSPQTPIKLLHAWLKSEVSNYDDKIDWIRRANQFANRYFKGNKREMTYCLKDVHNWKIWCDLKRQYVDVDWSLCFEDEYGSLYFGTAGEACSGGACELGELGATISEKNGSKI